MSCDALRHAIEDLAETYDYSGRSTNVFGGVHVTIINGAIHLEGEPAAPWPGLKQASDRTLDVVRRMRGEIPGAAALFWRALPKIEKGGSARHLRLRLSLAAIAGSPAQSEEEDEPPKHGYNRHFPCLRCGALGPDENGHDPCIAGLPGVEFACCGHGEGSGYVKFADGRAMYGRFT